MASRVEYAPGRYLPGSNAILFYLAQGTPFLTDDPVGRAEALRWMFFEQYSHEPFIATSRFIIHFQGRPAERAAELEQKRAPGYAALDVMEGHLGEREYFAGPYGIADIALYAYTHVAHEGDFDLGGYPAVRAWLDRVRGQPRHTAITEV